MKLHHDDPVISTQIVRHVRNCLEMAGVPSEALLQNSGISPGRLDDRDDNVELKSYVQFFETAAIEAGNASFGLHAARLMSADGLGPLSFLFLSAPTLQKAFETFTEYLDTMQQATFNAFDIEDDHCFFSYAIRNPDISPRKQDAEYSIGVMYNLVKQYLGRNEAPLEVHFEHECQSKHVSYESYFGCPVFFEQPHNRLYLNKSILGQRSSALSPELFPIIVGHLQLGMHVPLESMSVAGRVREILMAQTPDALPKLDDVAMRLGLARTTLMRHLAREGVRFGTLVDERKLDFAQQLMAASNRTISDIALASGYSETSSFTRAFSRYMGVKPSVWRRQQKSPPVS
jgi:AraC-like DNA-binding protein